MSGVKGMKSGKRKYNLNQKYFDKWSHNMAYVLGFITADGSITGPKKYRSTLGIMLSSKDREVLEYIRNEICKEIPIKNVKKGKYIKVSFNSVYMTHILSQYNVVPNKSKSIKLDFKIPKKYLGDYLRGLFDGDGWVGCRRNSIESSIASGSRIYLEELRKRSGNLGHIRKQKGNCFSWYMSKADTLKFRELIYSNNGFSLKRKRDKFYSNFYTPSSRWWTNEDIEYLIANKKLSIKEISLNIKRSEKSVRSKLWRLGFRKF